MRYHPLQEAIPSARHTHALQLHNQAGSYAHARQCQRLRRVRQGADIGQPTPRRTRATSSCIPANTTARVCTSLCTLVSARWVSSWPVKVWTVMDPLQLDRIAIRLAGGV
jgi:hypothetical protein